MTTDPHLIDVLAGEMKYRCSDCRRWGRRSENKLRSDFGHHGWTNQGTRAYHGRCRECFNKARRLRRPKAGVLPARKFSHTVEVVDDYGVLRVVRLCSDCRHWLPADREYFDGRGKKRPGLAPFCRECRLRKQREEYRRNPVRKRAQNRKRHRERYGELRALDRALQAYDVGREFYPRRKVQHRDGWLPTGPLQPWLRETIARLNEETRFGHIAGGIKKLADGTGLSERGVRRLRDGEYATVRASVVAKLFEAAGGTTVLQDIWPDYEEALRLGDALRFDTNRRLSRERSAA